MKYHLRVDFLDGDLPVKTQSFQFSEDRWFTARIQVITLLKAVYSDDWDRLSLYLDEMDRDRLETGAYHTKATIRAVLDEVDFNEYLFNEDLSFDQIKKNLIMERDMYMALDDSHILTEKVQLTDTESIELLKGTNKLLRVYFQCQ